MNEQGQKNKQKTDSNSILNLSEIGTSLSDFEEVKSQNKNFTLLSVSYFYYEEKMKSKKNNHYYMIKKEIPEKFRDRRNFIRETIINSQLHHENIIRLYGYFEDFEKESKINEIYYE